MTAELDALMNFEVTGLASDEHFDYAQADAEEAAWEAGQAEREQDEYEQYMAARLADEAAEDAEVARMQADLDEMSDEELAEAAGEARYMAESAWGQLVISRYHEMAAERNF